MLRRCFTSAPLWIPALTLSLSLLTGCAHRLSGPIHSADGPPWISQGVAAVAGDVEPLHRIIMIGDAGYFLEGDPTLADLDAWARGARASTVIFLGDNIYNEGLTDDDREHGERILGQQLAATRAHKIFIPGNHDWGLLPRDQNARAIENQQRFVEEWTAGAAEFIPKNGCMGPTKSVLSGGAPSGESVVFIAVDPTPWINPRLREACPEAETQEDHLARLDAMLREHRDDFVVLASHYPMLTGGPHGGLTYGFLGDLIVTPIGWLMGGLGNTYEPAYADWIARSQEVLRRNPPDIYAAGHDHNLQLLEAGDVAGIYVVSGAGARDRVSTVTHLPETYFAHAAPGFVVVDVGRRDGAEAVVLRVVEQSPEAPAATTTGDASEPVFEMDLP